MHLIRLCSTSIGLSFLRRHQQWRARLLLHSNGDVEPLAVPTKDPDINVNLFTIDMNYTWQIGPGSFVNVNWKTATELYDQLVFEKYYDNLKRTFNTPQQVTFSIKVIYYLDYLTLKGKGKRIN